MIERSEKARAQTGTLLSHLLMKGMFNESQLLEALTGEDCLLTIAEDMLVDIPKFWDFMAQILAPVLSSASVDMKFLKSSSACLMTPELADRCLAGESNILLGSPQNQIFFFTQSIFFTFVSCNRKLIPPFHEETSSIKVN